MEYSIFTVQDTKVSLYNRPFFARNKAEALRMFEDISNDPQHPVGQHPEDYVLYYIGTFSEKTGAILGDNHEALAKGSDFASVRSQPALEA